MLQQFPPMGVYETLFKFAEATAKYMGDPGTHPWAQGYPLTTQLPGGPTLPDRIELQSIDLKYPKATGEIELRERIADYYNEHYDAGIDMERRQGADGPLHRFIRFSFGPLGPEFFDNDTEILAQCV